MWLGETKWLSGLDPHKKRRANRMVTVDEFVLCCMLVHGGALRALHCTGAGDGLAGAAPAR